MCMKRRGMETKPCLSFRNNYYQRSKGKCACMRVRVCEKKRNEN